jgi:hypothetical protein
VTRPPALTTVVPTATRSSCSRRHSVATARTGSLFRRTASSYPAQSRESSTTRARTAALKSDEPVDFFFCARNTYAHRRACSLPQHRDWPWVEEDG